MPPPYLFENIITSSATS